MFKTGQISFKVTTKLLAALQYKMSKTCYLSQCIYNRCHKPTSKSFGFIHRHSSQVSQVALVAHQHDDYVVIGVISQFTQPPLNVLVCEMFCNVVDKQGTDSTAVVPAPPQYVNCFRTTNAIQQATTTSTISRPLRRSTCVSQHL